MRVIAGSRRSIPLTAPPGKDVRPTTDRIKETLFNIIAGMLPGARFLDLFAGSGQIGIEALSRGAETAVFVDNDPQAIRCIEANLAKTRFSEMAKVYRKNVSAALDTLRGQEAFDLIFLDPPYQMDGQEVLLAQIGRMGILAEHGVLILEAGLKREFPSEALLPLICTREKTYKTNKHLFFTYDHETSDLSGQL